MSTGLAKSTLPVRLFLDIILYGMISCSGPPVPHNGPGGVTEFTDRIVDYVS